MVAGLVVPGCEGPSAVVKSPTYPVLSRNQYVASYTRDEGGVAKKWQMMTRGRGGGGVTIPPKNDDVIYEQPLTLSEQ